jgi:hypothetical protein
MRGLISAALCLVPTMAWADGGAEYAKAVDAVVSVIRRSPAGDIYCGTGVMVREDIVLTAEHVIRSGPVEVVFAARDHTGAVISRPAFYASRGQACRTIAVSHERGLALLRLIEPVDDVDVVGLAPAGAAPLDPVFTVGAGSTAALWHVAAGYVRKGSSPARGGIEVSIPLSPGDAGAPILDRNAMLVGLKLDTVPDGKHMSRGAGLPEIRQFLAESLPTATTARIATAGSARTPAARPARRCEGVDSLRRRASGRISGDRVGRCRACGECECRTP